MILRSPQTLLDPLLLLSFRKTGAQLPHSHEPRDAQDTVGTRCMDITHVLYVVVSKWTLLTDTLCAARSSAELVWVNRGNELDDGRERRSCWRVRITESRLGINLEMLGPYMSQMLKENSKVRFGLVGEWCRYISVTKETSMSFQRLLERWEPLPGWCVPVSVRQVTKDGWFVLFP